MKSELIDDEDFMANESEDGDSEQNIDMQTTNKTTEEHAKMARRCIEIMREERDLRLALDDIFDNDD